MSDARAAGWSAAHHGIDPAQVPGLARWLRGVWVVAAPLARAGVRPLALTWAGFVCAVASVFLVTRVSPWVALVFVLASVAFDALDGAVAVLAGRVTAIGAVADRVADRVADCAFALVIWRCGAPLWLTVLAGGLSLAHEGVREVRRGRLLSMITVAERPSRTICAVLACVCAGVSDVSWPPTVCAAVWVGLAVIGLGQLFLSTSTFRGDAARSNVR